MAGLAGDLMQATAVWVAVDRAEGGPVPLGAAFQERYGPAAGGRRVSARLSHPGPPAAAGPGQPWPLRGADFDTAGHVNNSIHWAAVEDVLPGLGWLPPAPRWSITGPSSPGTSRGWCPRRGKAGLSVWLCGGGPRRLASAVLHPAGGGPGPDRRLRGRPDRRLRGRPDRRLRGRPDRRLRGRPDRRLRRAPCGQPPPARWMTSATAANWAA